MYNISSICFAVFSFFKIIIVLSTTMASSMQQQQQQEEEVMPAFDAGMYPDGVNANFYNTAKLPDEEILQKFSGLFEDGETRDIARCAPDLLKLLSSFGLQEGARIVDLGCGTGLLLNGLCKAVGPSGSVIATEISEVFHKHLLRKCASEELTNAICVLNADPRSPQLEPYKGTVDLVIIIDVYHHLEYPRTSMRHLRDALKPTGKESV